jgi:putative spermidine/putrescine transport system substrate-binding protein
MRGIDVKRIANYERMVPVFTKGLAHGQAVSRQGTAPIKVSYLQGELANTFATEPTQWMTLIPTVYNADTLGIRPDLIGRPITQWRELLNPEFRGKTAILNIPSIGIMDAAMASESMGVLQYSDKGNMTREEIDKTIALLIDAKKKGQFRAFWKEFNESVNLMASGEVIIQSMWSPAVTKVRQMGSASTNPSKKATVPGPQGLASHDTSPAKSLMSAASSSTGICRAGSARF